MPEINDLPPVPSAQGTDVFPVDQGATTYKETVAQLTTYINANVQLAAPTQVTGLIPYVNTNAQLAAATQVTGLTAYINANAQITEAQVTNLTTDLAAKQPIDAALTSIAGLTNAAGNIVYTTGTDTFANAPISALGLDLINDTTQAAMNTTIGSVPIAGGTMTGGFNVATASVSGAIALDSTYFGKGVICTGSAAYTVTLPPAAGNGGKYIEFVINTTSFAIVTLAGQGGALISGQASVPFGTYEGCKLYCDGTNWVITYDYLQPVHFKGYVLNQNIPANVLTALQLTTITDVGNFYINATGYYNPKYPGVYNFGSRIFANSTPNIASPELDNLLSTTTSEIAEYNYLQVNSTTPQSNYTSPVFGTFTYNGTTDQLRFEVRNIVVNPNLQIQSAFCYAMRVSRF